MGDLTMNLPLVTCILCGDNTFMLGTKLCDRCWELNRRMRADPEIARKIQLAMDQERNPEPPLGVTRKEWKGEGL